MRRDAQVAPPTPMMPEVMDAVDLAVGGEFVSALRATGE